MTRFHAFWITRSGRSGTSGDPAARFPFWSVTKTAIAITALQAVEAGRITLDAPLPPVDDAAPYSLRQLLDHSAGLPDYGPLPAYKSAVAEGQRAWPRATMLAQALPQGRLFAPGAGWAYSNIGSMLALEAVEGATGQPLAALITEGITRPLGLNALRLAEGPGDFADLHWPEARRYDPGWVYHRCLTGTAEAAARLIHGLFTGQLLEPATMVEMLRAHPLGGALPGQPWTRCGYSPGLMNGEMGEAGRAIGHSGAGPFSSNAAYHFPDLPDAPSVAVFALGPDEGPAELEAARIALSVST